MPERRAHRRVKLKISVRGRFVLADKEISVAGSTDNISIGGAKIDLSQATSIDTPAELVGAIARLTFTSYIENNFSLPAEILEISGEGGHKTVRIRFKDVEKETEEIIERLIKTSPSLGESADPEGEELQKFESIDDFMTEMTEFVAMTNKHEPFYIGGQKFMFVGMHFTESGEVHSDCIESVDRKNMVFCPDCRKVINPVDLA
jgi:hypothetical protein